jgi:alpha-mannosidase
MNDPGDTWGHGVTAHDDEAGEFKCVSVQLIENGPVRSIVRVHSRWGASTLREDYVLGAHARHVDVRVALDWREPLKMLKLRYPTSVDTATATFEIPYGHIVRPANGDEEPGQTWVDVSGERRGLTVINDAKYGYDVRGGDIGISAVRSPVWAWHLPRELEPGGDYEYMDQGRQTFRVRLVPHTGDWHEAGVVRLAAELNQPPFALIETSHRGPLPQRASYGSDRGGDVMFTVLKRAEDGDGYAVRAYETAGQPATVRLDVLGETIEASFGAYEIKTFVGGRETDLLEW